MSTNAFASAVGLKRSENLYQIKRGSFGISRELARLITERYPMVSRIWLLTGTGEMIDISYQPVIECKNEDGIPVYQCDILSLLTLTTQKPLYNINIPMFTGADFAAQTMSEAMSPAIGKGAFVVARRACVDGVLSGEVYLVATADFVAVRRVYERMNELVLRADNEMYSDVVVEKRQVSCLYAVVGTINIF